MKKIVIVKNLSRTFKSYEKEVGLTNAIKSLFHRKWKTVSAVDNISFEIEAGEFVGFLGPNGAGKTTTLKILSGILQPSCGTIEVGGFIPFERKPDFKKRISLVMGQKTQLIWDLPAADTFELHRDMYELDAKIWRKLKDELIELLNLNHVINTPVRQLSLGERMKCEIIVSLLHQPEILFLDEPTIGLDVVSQKNLWEFLRDYQKRNNTTILLTSHYMQDISNLCKRVIVINKGKIIFDDPLEELIELTQPDKKVIIKFNEELSPARREEINKLIASDNMERIDKFNYRLSIPRLSFTRIAMQLLKDFPVEELQIEEDDLTTIMQKSFNL